MPRTYNRRAEPEFAGRLWQPRTRTPALATVFEDRDRSSAPCRTSVRLEHHQSDKTPRLRSHWIRNRLGRQPAPRGRWRSLNPPWRPFLQRPPEGLADRAAPALPEHPVRLARPEDLLVPAGPDHPWGPDFCRIQREKALSPLRVSEKPSCRTPSCSTLGVEQPGLSCLRILSDSRVLKREQSRRLACDFNQKNRPT